LAGLAEARIEHDEGMALWVETPHDSPEATNQLEHFLTQRRPTAVVLSSWVIMQAIWPLVRDRGLLVPRDLSIVSFDQHPSMAMWLGNVNPTSINMPLAD